MGTSRNQRSPAELRWRLAQAAYGGGSAPRAVAELFRAADTDGWLASLASPACAAFGQAAAQAVSTLPDRLASADSSGVAVRQVVDDARLAALNAPGQPESGLIPALAERALTRVLVTRLQGADEPLSRTTPADALKRWQESAVSGGALAADQLSETIRQIVLHLVHRDGPQLVGGPVGASADVNALARQLSEVAAKTAAANATALLTDGVQAWPVACQAAWGAARELADAASTLNTTGGAS